MKCDLVIVGGDELGLIDHDYKGSARSDGVPVKRLSKGYTSCFAKENVKYVDLPVIKEATLTKCVDHPDKQGVHIAHCSKEHGCKYGDLDCPVVLGEVEQKYPCLDGGYRLEDCPECAGSHRRGFIPIDCPDGHRWCAVMHMRACPTCNKDGGKFR